MPLLADFIATHSPVTLPEHLTTWMPGKTPFSTYESSFALIITYLVVIFGIQAVLADQPPLKLNKAFQVHNLLLCIASAVMLGLFMEEIIPMIWNKGMFHALCEEEGWTPRLEFYYIINYYFKYYELIDTVFLALKKKPLRFLHVYHHAATALLGYATLNIHGTLSWTISTINLAVHVIMYYYYFRTARGANIWWKKYLTTMQITQFVVDLGVLAFAAYSRFAFRFAPFLPHQGDCYGSTEGGFFCCGLILSYLALFVDFYRQTFKKPSTSPKKLEGSTKSKAGKANGLTGGPLYRLRLRLFKWISWFLSSKGNEYFCEVDEDFIIDRFNLTGLNNEVTNYGLALDLITDNLVEDDIAEEMRGSLDVQARLLYGLIHARWIVTARGLQKMLEKYKRADFGRCPRVLCSQQPLLPVGLTDVPYEKSVKLYCGRCEDIYSPKSTRHGSIDGAYFGTTFPHLLFLVYPTLLPPKSGPADFGPAALKEGDSKSRRRLREEELSPAEGGGESMSTASVAIKADRYHPRIYGFQVHEIAKLQRWQDAVKERQVARLEAIEDRA